VSDDGCREETGECTCKRNVIGRDCDQCLPEHYGLALDNDLGCSRCECDIGGAYDNNCDVLNGQCKCRPNVGGRRCDGVIDGYYTGALDFLLFEGELAFGSQNPVSNFEKSFTQGK
jgi:laminin beta 1